MKKNHTNFVPALFIIIPITKIIKKTERRKQETDSNNDRELLTTAGKRKTLNPIYINQFLFSREKNTRIRQ